MRNYLKILFFLLLSSKSFGLDESLFHRYDYIINQKFKSKIESRFFDGTKNQRIHYLFFNQNSEKCSTIIFPGRTEPAIKYIEVMYDLKSLGCDLYIMDHRYQGKSGRALSDKHKGYVHFFQDYVKDAFTFAKIVRKSKKKNHKFYLIAHSMGGAISSLLLAKHPNLFDKAILSSPMHEISFRGYPKAISVILIKLMIFFNFHESYLLNQGRWNVMNDLKEFNPIKNTLTSSWARHEKYLNRLLNDPELIVGGATFNWMQESLKATDEIAKISEKVTTPILLFQAEADTIVNKPGQDHFCSKAKNCAVVTFPNAKHEIFQERDEIRNLAIEKILKFFSN